VGRRRRSREEALKLLYQLDLVPPRDLEDTLDLYWQERDVSEPEEVRPYADSIVRGVLEHTSDIDDLISSHTHNWRLERIAAVDRNILRMAIYEFLHQQDVPRAVVINEAIEIAKRYSTEESSQFINGVLDGIRRMLKSDEQEAPEASLP
jgi:N utilization substance protein B